MLARDSSLCVKDTCSSTNRVMYTPLLGLWESGRGCTCRLDMTSAPRRQYQRRSARPRPTRSPRDPSRRRTYPPRTKNTPNCSRRSRACPGDIGTLEVHRCYGRARGAGLHARHRGVGLVAAARDLAACGFFAARAAAAFDGVARGAGRGRDERDPRDDTPHGSPPPAVSGLVEPRRARERLL